MKSDKLFSIIVLVCALFLFSLPSTTAFGCCLEDTGDYPEFCFNYELNVDLPDGFFGGIETAECLAYPGNTFVKQNLLCSPVSGLEANIFPGCQPVCSCPVNADGEIDFSFGQTSQVVTSDVCGVNPDTVCLDLVTTQFAQECSELCGEDDAGQVPSDPDLTCVGIGGDWCALSQCAGGDVFGDDEISDEGYYGSLVCCASSCDQTVEPCIDAGGEYYGQGQFCQDGFAIEGVNSCCQVGYVSDYTCGTLPTPGVVCSSPDVCGGSDFTQLLSFDQQQQLGNNVCCEDLGTESCVAFVCEENDHEIYCNDGQDNDCNELVDGADPTCSGLIQGVVHLVGNPDVPIEDVFLRFEGDVLQGDVPDIYYTSSGPDGTFTIPNVAWTRLGGVYEVYLQSGQGIYSLIDADYSFTVTDGAVIDLVLEIEYENLASVSGQVIDDATGIGVPGAYVFIPSTPHFGLSSADGSFFIPDVVEGTDYNIYAYHPDYLLSDQLLIDVPTEPVTIPLFQSFCADDVEDIELSTEHIIGSATAALFWSQVSCDFAYAVLHRCAGDESMCNLVGGAPTGEYSAIASFYFGATTYMDDTAQWDQQYYYVLEVHYLDDPDPHYSNQVDFFTGSSYCEDTIDPTMQFCIKEYEDDGTPLVDAGYTCNAENLPVLVTDQYGVEVNCISPVLTCDEYIVDGDDTVYTQCVTIGGSCEALDDLGEPFNMFANYNDEACNAQDGCYYDLGDSVVNACVACSLESTCNSYKTQSACDENACGIGSLSNPCSWVSFNDELNLGTCVNTEESDCESCQSQNGVLGTCPSADICENPAGPFSTPESACYFNSGDSTCNSCELVNCYDLLSEQECVGSDGTRAPFDFLTFDFITEGDIPGMCGLAQCVWLDDGDGFGQCVRDDNNNGLNDCALPEFTPDYASVETCMQYDEPPQTTLVAPPFHDPDAETTLTFSVFDPDISIPEDLNTYYCVEKTDTNTVCTGLNMFNVVPPSGAVTFTDYIIDGVNDYELHSGSNTIYYLSRDALNNYEAMQTFEFVIDDEGPIIDLGAWAQEGGGSPPLHTVIIHADIQGGEQASCALDLLAGDANCVGSCQDFGPYQISHTRVLTDVPDGFYEIRAVCKDIFDNEATEIQSFTFDFDQRALHPMPQGPVESLTPGTGIISLGIETTQPVLCRYTDIIMDFDSIPASQTIDPFPSYNDITQRYEHQGNAQFPINALHQLYIVCSFAVPSIDTITFTIDEQLPDVQLLTYFDQEIIGDSFTVTDPRITLNCVDYPDTGFGCADVHYCTTTIGGQCTPIPQGGVTETQIELIGSGVVCVAAEELEIGDYGGRVSDARCVTLYLDQDGPTLYLDDYPEVVQDTPITLTGYVLDTAYINDEWLIDTENEFVENPITLSLTNFKMLGTLVVPYEPPSMLPRVDVMFRYAGPNNHYKLRLDATDTDELGNPRVSLIRRSSGENIILTSSYLQNWETSGMPVEISVSGDDIIATLADITLEATVPGLSSFSGKQLGIMKSASPEYAFYFTGVEASDLDAPQNNQVRFFRGEDGSTEAVSTDATGYFVIETSLDTETSGEATMFTLWGVDAAGLTSEAQEIFITLDLDGPIVNDLAITQAPDDVDNGFIEFGTDAFFAVSAEDRGFSDDTTIATIEAEVGGNTYPILFEDGAWKSLVATSELPSLGTYTVVIHATDLGGNPSSQEFPSALELVDSSNPAITLLFDAPLLTSDPTPTFSISTSEIADCTLTYDSASQDDIIQNFLRDDLEHTITLSQELACASGTATVEEALIVCEDSSGNQDSYQFNIVCDQRPPTAALFIPGDIAHLRDYDRSVKDYYLHNDYLGSATLTMLADEPVQCKYCDAALPESDCSASTPFIEMTGTFVYDDGDFGTSGETASMLTFDTDLDPMSELYVKCIDEVGNIADAKQVNIFELNDYGPIMFGLTETAFSTSNALISVYTKRSQADCAITFTDADGTHTYAAGAPISVDGLKFKHNFAFPMTVEGSFAAELSCAIGSDVSTLPFTLVYDTLTPALNSISPDPTELVIATEATITVTGNAPNAERVSLFREGQELWSSAMSGDFFSAPIGLVTGRNVIDVVATRQTGESAAVAVTVDYNDEAGLIEILGLRSFTLQNALSPMPLYASGTYIIGGDLRLYRTTQSGLVPVGTGQTIMLGEESYNFFPNHNIGRNYYYAEIVQDGQVIGAANFRVSIDELGFAPSLWSVFPYSSEFDSPDLQAYIAYENLITDRVLYVGNDLIPLDMYFSELTANNIPSGTNNFNLTVTNDIGHTAYLYSTIVKDGTSPILEQHVIAGTEDIIARDNTPTIALTFNEPARVTEAFLTRNDNTYAISFDSGYFGEYVEITVTTPLDEEGEYTLAVSFEDPQGNGANENGRTIVYEQGPFELTLLEPSFGVAFSEPFNFEVSSNRVALCYWSLGYKEPEYPLEFMTPFDNTGGVEHHIALDFTIGVPEGQQIPVTVKCEDEEGTNPTDTHTVFDLSLDSSPPAVTTVDVLNDVDGVIIEPTLIAQISVAADEPIVCDYRFLPGGVYEYENLEPLALREYSNPFIVDVPVIDEQSYDVEVYCENQVELSDTGTVSFSTNFGATSDITIVTPEEGYTTEPTHVVEVSLSKNADLFGPGGVPGCQFKIDDESYQNFVDTGDLDLWVSSPITFSEGAHFVTVRCFFDAQEVSNVRGFTVDNAAPFVSAVDVDEETPLDYISFSVDATDGNEGSGIKHYHYEIGTGTFGDARSDVTSGITDDATPTIDDLDLSDGQTYYVTVQAEDNVGLFSEWVSSSGVVAVEDFDPPGENTCTNGVQDGSESDTDCGGACNSCLNGATCNSNNDCLSDICQDGICVAGGACFNGDQDNDETDVDCGGLVCDGCADGLSCVVDSDCLGGSCHLGVCSTASCSDGLHNGYETDIDCGGGFCPDCGSGETCVSNADCASGICTDGQCADATCVDNVQNQDESDVDCGGSCGDCPIGDSCTFDSDCQSGICEFGVCTDGSSGSSGEDSDGDGLPDQWEIDNFMNPDDPFDATLDSDNDGLTNYEEYVFPLGQLDPNNPDTDGDGHDDGTEVENNTNPLDSNDYPRAKWLTIILLLLAFVIVGGTLGYFGYTQYIAHNKPKRPLPKPGGSLYKPVTPGPHVPPSATPIHHKSKSELIKEALQKKLSQQRKDAEHASVDKSFDTFGSSTPKKKTAKTVSKKTASSTPAVKATETSKPAVVKKDSSAGVDKLKKKMETKSTSAIDKLRKGTKPAKKATTKKKSSVKKTPTKKTTKKKSSGSAIDKLKKKNTGKKK